MHSAPTIGLARAWGIGFWIFSLGHASLHLWRRASTVVQFHLTTEELITLVLAVLFFLRVGVDNMTRWSAVLVLRAAALAQEHSAWHFVLAPLYVGGFYAATRKRLMKAYGLVAFIVVVSVTLRQLPDPWPEIVDVGVVINLGIGAMALLMFSATAFIVWIPKLSPNRWAASADLPEGRFPEAEAADTAAKKEAECEEGQANPRTTAKEHPAFAARGGNGDATSSLKQSPSGGASFERSSAGGPGDSGPPQLMQAAALAAGAPEAGGGLCAEAAGGGGAAKEGAGVGNAAEETVSL